jgi:urease accessory protein
MPADIITIMRMNERTMSEGRKANTKTKPPPPLAGGGWGEGVSPVPWPPPPTPLPQGEGEAWSLVTWPALLHLLAWLSPAFPTGGYAYSHGLEWSVQCGDITDGTTLLEWLDDILAHGSGRNDAILLRHAHRARDWEALNELAIAIAPSRERRIETLDQGTAFVAAATAWQPPELPERVAYPVAVGALAGRHGIDEDATTAAYLQAFITNLISAAVRLVPLGQSTGLRILAALEPTILRVASESRAATLDDLGGCAFRSDLAAMRHETQYTRLFRS